MWKIKFESVDEAKEFHDVCVKYTDININLIAKHRYVDAKSWLGMLGVIHDENIIKYYCDDPYMEKDFIDEIRKVGAYETD